MQLAIYLGWKMHGTRGGLVAGLAFVVPAILLLTVLSYVYARFGTQPLVSGLLVGLKAAVIALVVQALVKIGRRALKGPVHWLLALGAFVALEILRVPFPLIVLAAGLVGWFTAPRSSAVGTDSTSAAATSAALKGAWFTESSARVVTAGIALWLVPAAFVGLFTGFDSLWSRLYLFFTQAALVTFGGAYAVLAYINQAAVLQYHWLLPGQMVTGLGLAESTPGPLIMVTEFVGFIGAYRHPGALDPTMAGILGATVTTWATFAPCFLWIFLGAPYIERLRGNRSLSSALGAVTAAVVGIIADVAVTFGIHTLFDQVRFVRVLGGPVPVPVLGSVDVFALGIAVASFVAVWRFRVGVLWVVAISATVGVLRVILR
jgi:chromate transporter